MVTWLVGEWHRDAEREILMKHRTRKQLKPHVMTVTYKTRNSTAWFVSFSVANRRFCSDEVWRKLASSGCKGQYWLCTFFFLLNCLRQRSPNFLDAGTNSRPYQCPRAGLFCALKKTKQKTARITSETFLRCSCFLCLITCLQCDFCNSIFGCMIVAIFGFPLGATLR